MKIKPLFIIAVIAILNFSCANHKYENDTQPAPDASEALHIAQANTNEASSTNAVVKSNYEYPDDNGIGPVKTVDVGPIDQSLVSIGKKIYNTKCIACHQLDTRLVGPPLRNITKKNTPVFIMNYLLNTTDMQKKDPLLKKLVEEYKIVMPDQQLTQKDARGILEYFRSIEK